MLILKICGVLMILMGLLLSLWNVFVGILAIVGGVLAFMYKMPYDRMPEREKPNYHFETIKIRDQDEKVNKNFFRDHLEDLYENGEYHLSKKELLEDYSGKVYKYDSLNYPCKIEDNKIIVDDIVIGTIADKYISKIDEAIGYEVVFYPGKYKYVGEDSVETDEHDSYFELLLKKQGGN